MASTHTTNLGLNKPDRQDLISVVNDINDNMDMIDIAIGNPSSASGVTGSDAFSKIGTLNSNVVFKSKSPYYGSLKTISNCLLIDINNMDGEYNDAGIVTNSSQYAPTDLITGIREVFWISSSNIAVKINGISSTGWYKEWVRYYNGSTWTEWNEFALNSKILLQNITSSTSIASMCSSLASLEQKTYYIESSDKLTDYPSALSSIDANAYIVMRIAKYGAVCEIIIEATKTNGAPVAIFGNAINGTLRWSSVIT